MLLVPSATRRGRVLISNALGAVSLHRWLRDLLDAAVSGQRGSMTSNTLPHIMAMCAQRHMHAGVEEKDVEVAKDILDAIMSGHVEGMPGEDADMGAEEEAQEERHVAPRR